MNGLSWLAWVAVIGFLGFLIARCLAQPEEPWFKWALPLSWVGVSLGAVLEHELVLVPSLVLLVVAGVWDRAWRLGQGESTLL